MEVVFPCGHVWKLSLEKSLGSVKSTKYKQTTTNCILYYYYYSNYFAGQWPQLIWNCLIFLFLLGGESCLTWLLFNFLIWNMKNGKMPSSTSKKKKMKEKKILDYVVSPRNLFVILFCIYYIFNIWVMLGKFVEGRNLVKLLLHFRDCLFV